MTRALLLVALGAMGCPSPAPALVDAGTSDSPFGWNPAPPAPPPANVVDAGSVGDWITLPAPQPIDLVPTPCGRGEPIAYFTPQSNYHLSFTDDAILSFGSYIRRTDRNLVTTRIGPGGFDTVFGTTSTARWTLFSYTTSRPDGGRPRAFSAALLDMSPDLTRGRIFWRRDFPPAQLAELSGGLAEHTGTSSFIAMVIAEPNGGRHLWVGGPHAEGLHQAPIPDLEPANLRAEGDRLIFELEGDIWLYTHTGERFENLTNDRAVQIQPWISGDHAVWVDMRDGGGSTFALNNPEVYLMDLRDRSRRRITHDPPERPAIQLYPMIEGDWIVWADQRLAAEPNIARGLPRRGIYAWHIGTQREVAIDEAEGDLNMGIPYIHQGWVYYACAHQPPNHRDSLYRQRMPAASAGGP